MKCSKCGSRDIDFQESIGQSICVNCGTVLEENTIVSSIEFQVCCALFGVLGR
jgi:transcription factor IIIB subunit 2